MTHTAPHILYEDNHCLAACKPPSLLTQGVPEGIVTLESLVKDYLRQRHGKAGRVYLGIPHRLDRPVSGVVLFWLVAVACFWWVVRARRPRVTKSGYAV